MDCYQFIDVDSKSGVGRSSVPEKSDFDRNLLGVLVQPPVLRTGTCVQGTGIPLL